MNTTDTPSGPGRWIPVRDRVTDRLLCEYNPTTGRIRVRRGRRYYTALLPSANPTPKQLAQAAHQLLHPPCPEGVAARGACPEGPDRDPPDP